MIPPGWDYNPAGWMQRLPIAAVAMLGFFLAGYLSLYQFGLIDTVWDPFFGGQTMKILDSPVSRLLPVPDAFLGALGYLLDAVAAVIGGRNRWKTMPWVVVTFGILVGPLGAISIALVIAQPVVYGAWCTICLATAAISVAMIGPAMDEVLASLQHLKRERDANGWSGAWRAFKGRPA